MFPPWLKLLWGIWAVWLIISIVLTLKLVRVLISLMRWKDSPDDSAIEVLKKDETITQPRRRTL